jgi:hypothetical protein
VQISDTKCADDIEFNKKCLDCVKAFFIKGMAIETITNIFLS